ncbi:MULTISPECIES: S24 family peptidase [unclassified Dysgonomonas]|uniref:S24 family peptidase n=1 Tax=unclassified Dysgonomonas TaxID=2630389 RepID=UPI0013ED1488|nr:MULTISPECIES: S24 family peptidase [unclassified Dysgonomonas]
MDSWNRLNEVIISTGLTTNAFASSIGLKRSENLYRIKKGKNSISKDLADAIATKYCNISKSWLLTGEGSMYIENNEKDTHSSSYKKIPFYDSVYTDIEPIADGKKNEPSYYIEVPSLMNCDFATLFVGDSMAPEIPSGAIVTLKEINIESILPGEMYLIVTDAYSTIKYIRTAENDNSILRLIPKNTESYDDAIIKKAQIKRLYLVKGVISTKVL